MRLRIVTYNIHRAIGVDRRFRLERISDILDHHQPDLALLQEVDQGALRSGRMDLASELANRLDFSHYAVGYNVTLRKGRYGNATLSRHPIVGQENIDLSLPFRKRRGCQYTHIRIGDGEGQARHLMVFNLHLGLSAQERARQIGTLARSEEFGAIKSTEPCIVGGDFNDWRLLLHPIFTDILGFGCATHRRYGFGRGLRTYPSFSPRGDLDRIYFRGTLRLVSSRTCRLRQAKVASDHLPVIADFELS